MRLVLLVISCVGLAWAAPRQVAITIDDLPVAHSGPGACGFDRLMELTGRLLKPIREGKVPVTAFVIAGNCEALTDAQWRGALKLWMDAGAEIGNHTWSHQSLTTTPVAEYEADIQKADERIRSLTGKARLEYFRSPMLHTGATPAVKVELERFLAEHRWTQSPVTFDNSDWMFSYVLADARKRGDKSLEARVKAEYVPYMESVIEFFERRSVEVVGREFPQILLMHANVLNSELLPDLLGMLKRRGYQFISLREALKDPAYSLPNDYAGGNGISWLHRWSRTKGMPPRGEPDEPKWLTEAHATARRPAK